MGREILRKRRGRWAATVLVVAALVVWPAVLWAEAAPTATVGPAASTPAAEDSGAQAKPAAPKTAGNNGKGGNGKIELHVKDDQLANVLELLSQQYRLNIVATKGATGKVTADLYDVTVEEALDAICQAVGLGWQEKDGVIYIYTAEQLKAMAEDESRMVTEVFTLNYLSAEEAVKLLEPAKSEKGTVTASTKPEEGIPSGSSGGTGGNSFSMPDTVVARDFPENIEQMRKILERMDRRPRQVLVEATILQVTLDDTTSLGIDFNALAGVDFRDLSTVATPVTDPTTNANDATVTIGAAQRPWGTVATTGFATPGTGLNIGVMTNNVAFFIHALEEVTDTTILSNPKVLALNKQRAEVMVGQRLGYRTTTVTETSAVETVEFLDTGTQLVFRPFISDDGYVRMEIHPEVSSGDIVNELPQETTTEVTCNVMVKDGHTIVIGGLFDETVSVGRAQVPGLGNIPLLGWLFRNKEDSSTRHEIIVLLTPHIIEHEEDAAALGESILTDAKRRCLGMREGFGFYTRERITVGYLQAAKAAWARYRQSGSEKDLDEAWWNVQVAADVAPNNLEAMRLKDKILTAKTGEPYSPADLTVWDSIRERLRLIDKARGVAVPRPPGFRVPKKAAPPKSPAPGEAEKPSGKGASPAEASEAEAKPDKASAAPAPAAQPKETDDVR